MYIVGRRLMRKECCAPNEMLKLACGIKNPP